MAENDSPMIFFNIGWMVNYRGQTEADRLRGDFKYIQKNGTGHEQYNFLPTGGWLFGYAPAKWNEDTDESTRINIDRIGANPADDHLEGTDVIFFSRNPDDGNAYIIGWYRNATLYRKARELPKRKIDGARFFYFAKTHADDGFCVPQSKRAFIIPSAHQTKGGYGQSPVWYGDKIPGFRGKVRKYISGFNKTKAAIAAPKSVNLEAKLLVEQNAVDATKAYYQELGFKVKSVEKDNCGWDLTAKHPGGVKLLIEVKGLSGQQISVQLTPNEYKTLKERHDDYILAICTNALATPDLHIFMIRKQNDGVFIACDDDGNILEFVESVSAVAQFRE
ncbi:DUF3883 domain-containing protein [Desulfovibrio sp. ZJ369]|uniref:DUF3883 domain-containing protein n=1 Tax=Desulfovibrio sp. ZJ369 TaxID=2709793 RepID=UPI0013EB32BF|nr:DUF3883 domain-containing protein [Desulfovibrio sp. ZJ369]